MSCKAFCEAKRCNNPTCCCGGAESRHQVKRGTGNDWMLREARLEEEPPIQGIKMSISFPLSIVKCVVQLMPQLEDPGHRS